MKLRLKLNISLGLGTGVLSVMIVATCLLLGNLYYAQPILFDIADSLRISMDDSGLLVAFGQIGYIAGLVFLAPLGDAVDNSKLCFAMSLGAGVSALAAAAAVAKPAFLASLFFMGAFAAATQVLVVYATSLSGERSAGRTLGIMACGVFLGIALSRPFSSLVTALAGWRLVYCISGVALLAISVCIHLFLPRQQCRPPRRLPYFIIIRGLVSVAIHAKRFIPLTSLSFLAFMSFTMFWSSAPLCLAGNFRHGQGLITALTMCGFITPPAMLILGRMLDKGNAQAAALTAFCLVFAGWAAACFAPWRLWLFFMAALLVDPCSCAVTVTVQKAILASVDVDMRGRANSLNISINFLGGTLGAILGPLLLERFSWACVAMAGLAMPAGALVLELRSHFRERSL